MKKGFTLIELLVVITIIGILAGLIVGAGASIQESGRRNRAKGEIAALDTALERYKIDNGDYPSTTRIQIDNDLYSANTESYIGDSPSVSGRNTDGRGTVSGGDGGQLLLACLLGRRTLKETETVAYPQYIEVKPSQVSSDGTYFKDPYNNPYGYYYDASGKSGSNNQKSLFNVVDPDLWSTGPAKSSDTAPSTNSTNAKGYATYLKWITNWASQ
ncbi:MAG: prepilin-type N-terminal cleavage/methylation domain-containing protein [Verrucomicrobiales bacterium]|jgi:prepilin-type N-terminal cleavage/methylation domain-containing protein|nr:prepilin-type N-terminal cleavage/methylation domain-containing protein [Verrucomicrobiales bacterium]